MQALICEKCEKKPRSFYVVKSEDSRWQELLLKKNNEDFNFKKQLQN